MGEMDLVLTIGMFELLRRQHGANIAMATTNNAGKTPEELLARYSSMK